ncbi:MAG TPA: efflux RND transporter periplasmic adaptor subunit [Rhizomicrobium sp.]|nr:efflux RND transporter periplasmic adaptor subunit [Rhizomicrobium sp.]
MSTMMTALLTRWRAMKARYQWAIGIALGVTAWLLTGLIFPTDSGHAQDAQAKAEATPVVKVRNLSSSKRNATITVRGRTQALHEVDVRAEVEGVVEALHFEKGDRVKTGQVLCQIKVNDRASRLSEAQALASQRTKEYEVAAKLFEDGFRSKTQMAQAEAALQAARAAVNTQAISVNNTRIKAPFAGVIDDRYVNVGDYMRPGDKCALLIAPEPFLATATLNENDVGSVSMGDPAVVTLVTGEVVNGKVRFVADRADSATRAFKVEVELPNPDAKLRDGVSADIRIPVRQVKAQQISPGILVLDDSGKVGVRTVQNGKVAFVPVQVVSDGLDGMWITGLPDQVTVITVGQEFVSDGEPVKTVPDTSTKVGRKAV